MVKASSCDLLISWANPQKEFTIILVRWKPTSKNHAAQQRFEASAGPTRSAAVKVTQVVGERETTNQFLTTMTAPDDTFPICATENIIW